MSFVNFFFFFWLHLFVFFLDQRIDTDTTHRHTQTHTDTQTHRFIYFNGNLYLGENMAATANIVYASVCDKSEEWIEKQLEQTTDKLALVLSINHRACVLPMLKVEQVFDTRGYGKDKTSKWLARWKYLDKIDWVDINRLQRYVIFKECKLDDRYLTKLDKALEEAKAEDQRKMAAVKAEGEKKEAAKAVSA